MKLVVEQRHVGPRGFLACVLIIATLHILAIDMYAPALPKLQEDFGASASLLNLTMFIFMFVAAFAVLIAGPLSDKFGRKPVLLTACLLFTLSSLGCMISTSVIMLSAFRFGQAIGFGFVTTLESALVKDAYTDRDLKLCMSLVQSLILIGPVFAPFLGTFFLGLGSWRYIFAFLMAGGCLATVLACLLSETLPQQARLSDGVGAALAETGKRVRTLLGNGRFRGLTGIVSLAGLPFMSFIAVVSYVLLDDFGVSYTIYNAVYATVALTSVVAPFIYLKLSHTFGNRPILLASFVVSGVSAVLMGTIGHLSPYSFLVAFVLFALIEGIIRPLSFVILLDQRPEQVGAASAWVNFVYSVFGSFGTIFATLPWPTYIFGLTCIMGVSTVLMVALYALRVRVGASS